MGTLEYQWQINQGSGWVDIKDATDTSYTTEETKITYNGYQYRCIVRDANGNVTSNTATLTVTNPVIPQTGDNSMPTLWFTLSLLALAGLAATGKKRLVSRK
jgi:LPXTG-motif cell wall-anchored protein